MFRIDNATAVVVMPTPAAPGPNPNGYFTAPDPMNDIPGTVLTADWCNSIQEELCSILDAASITPDKSVDNQVLSAINYLINTALSANAFVWDLISTDQVLVPKHGVVTNSGITTINLLLPAMCPVGSIIKVVRFNGDFNITQNDGQVIWYGNASTTTGVDGYISPTGNNASVDLLCVTANTTFLVVNSQGAFSVN